MPRMWHPEVSYWPAASGTGKGAASVCSSARSSTRYSRGCGSFSSPAIRPAGHCPYVHHRHNSCNPVCPGQVRCTSAVSHSRTPSRFHQPAHLKADTRACLSAAPDCSSHHAPSGHCDLMATPHRISGCKGWSWWKCPAAVHLNRSALWPDGGMTISMSQGCACSG